MAVNVKDIPHPNLHGGTSTKEVEIKFRVSRELKSALESHCDGRGTTLSNWGRAHLYEALLAESEGKEYKPSDAGWQTELRHVAENILEMVGEKKATSKDRT